MSVAGECVRRKSKILQHHSLQLGLYWKQARVPAPQVDQPLRRHCGKSGSTRNMEEQPSPGLSVDRQVQFVATIWFLLLSPAVFQSYKKGLRAGMQRAIGQSVSANIQQVVSKQAHQKGWMEHVKLDSLLFSALFRSPSTCFHFKRHEFCYVLSLGTPPSAVLWKLTRCVTYSCIVCCIHVRVARCKMRLAATARYEPRQSNSRAGLNFSHRGESHWERTGNAAFSSSTCKPRPRAEMADFSAWLL